MHFFEYCIRRKLFLFFAFCLHGSNENRLAFRFYVKPGPRKLPKCPNMFSLALIMKKRYGSEGRGRRQESLLGLANARLAEIPGTRTTREDTIKRG